MKRFFLIYIFVFCLASFNVNAYNGGIQRTFIPDQGVDALEDKSTLSYYTNSYNVQKDTIDSYKRCASKNKYYMPGHSDVDEDECFDVLSYLEGESSKAIETYYVGNMDAAGDLKYFSIADNRARKGSGPFIADNYCNINFPGSRAMRYDDIVHLIKNRQMPVLSHSIFVFDAIRNFEGTDQVKLKTGEVSVNGNGRNWNCSNYTSRSSGTKSIRFRSVTGLSKMFLSNVGCNEKGYIVCVKDK